MAAYVELALVRKALGFLEESEDPEAPPVDTTRDDLIQLGIDAAAEAINDKTGRRFTVDEEPTTRRFLAVGRLTQTRGMQKLLVDDISSPEGLAVQVDGRTVEFDYLPENAAVWGKPITALALFGGGLDHVRRFDITARWGWPAIPKAIEAANLIQAVRLFRRKDSPEGIAGSAEWGLVRVPNLDPDVKALIEPYKLPGFGA